jgi:hypothetical protein
MPPVWSGAVWTDQEGLLVRIHRSRAIAACLVAVLGLAGAVTTVFAAGNTMRIDPASSAVAKDATFTVKLIQNASVATSGAQATITFDKAKVQVTKVTRGAKWAPAPIFAGASDKEIAAANKSGKLKTVAAAFLPPTSVPAGDQEFISVEFKAIACGQVKLDLPIGPGDTTFIDGRDATYGAAVKATATTGATVTVCTDAGGASLAPDGSSPTPGGSVLGATASPDLGAGASGDPIVDPSADPGAPSSDPGSVAQPSPSPSLLPAGAAGTSGDCPSCAARQDWLTFGLAAMAVAAVGLALLIVLVLGTLIVAGIVGLIAFLRRRRTPEPDPPAAASGGDGPTAGPTDGGTLATPAPAAPGEPGQPAPGGAAVPGVGEPGPG